MPSITMLTVLPGFIEPTPTDVPQAITSPGSRVMSCETRLTSIEGAKMMSDNGIVLPLLSVENGLDDEPRRVEARRDHRAEHAEGVEALGARPLCEPGVGAEDVDRR